MYVCIFYVYILYSFRKRCNFNKFLWGLFSFMVWISSLPSDWFYKGVQAKSAPTEVLFSALRCINSTSFFSLNQKSIMCTPTRTGFSPLFVCWLVSFMNKRFLLPSYNSLSAWLLLLFLLFFFYLKFLKKGLILPKYTKTISHHTRSIPLHVTQSNQR